MLLPLHILEFLSEGQVAHDVVAQVVRPLSHVLRWRPLPRPHRSDFIGRTEILTPDSHVLQDERFGRSERALGKGVLEDSSSKGMLVLVDLAVRAEGTRARIDGAVPVGFLDVSLARPVDFFQGVDGVDREGVRADTNNGSLRFEVRKKDSLGLIGLLEHLRMNKPYFSCSFHVSMCRSPLLAWITMDQPEILLRNGPGYFASGWRVRR